MKKSADQWFAEYGESHQNFVNEIVHWICVPTIALSLLGLLWAVKIPVPATFGDAATWVNLATVTIFFSMLFYLRLSIPIALGMLLFSVASLTIIVLYERADLGAVWIAALALFVVAWIGQFIGHKIEGKKPSFFKDLQFLLIGPAWLLHFIYRRLGIPY